MGREARPEESQRPRKGRSNEETIHSLHQVEGGDKVAEVCRRLGVTEQTLYRWKQGFTGLGQRTAVAPPRNSKLKRVAADLTLDRHILRNWSEESCDASPTSHPDGVGPDGVPSEPASGDGASRSPQRHQND
jgi:putative transposase